MGKKDNYHKGKTGESEALRFLEKKGYILIEKNYRSKGGEIDLIMKFDNWLIFVEVKLKIGDMYGTPEEMMTKNKMAQVKRTAYEYCMDNNIDIYENKLRIDGVCLVKDLTGKLVRICHYENIDQ